MSTHRRQSSIGAPLLSTQVDWKEVYRGVRDTVRPILSALVGFLIFINV